MPARRKSGDLDRRTLVAACPIAVAHADMPLPDCRDQVLVHAVGGAQTEFVRFVEVVDRAGFGAGSCTALVTIVLNTFSRSSVELTAWLTSPSARNSSTDCASSVVRARNSLSSRTFSIAITAWLAKLVTSSICLSVNGRTSCR